MAPPRDRLPTWAVASAVAAPVAMIGGWTLAGALQPRFDPVLETISALAATDATAPWVMTAGLAGTGAAHVVTALGLRPVPAPARAVHALGGLATLAVAALPVDAAPRAHGIAAGVAFGALALWPALAWRRGHRHQQRHRPGAAGSAPGPRAHAVLSAPVAVGAATALTGLLALFVLELQGLTPDDGAATGLTERLVAGAQALWPLVVVVALRRAASSTGTPAAAHAGGATVRSG